MTRYPTPSWCRRARPLVGSTAAFAALAAVATPVAADDISWIQADGMHAFTEPSNWDPAVVPAEPDDAVFDIPGERVVTFDANIITRLLVMGQGTTTFDLGGLGYKTRFESPNVPSTVVGLAPLQPARLVIVDGDFQSRGLAVVGDVDQAVGEVVVERGGGWTVGRQGTEAPALLAIGRSGAGRVFVNDGGFVDATGSIGMGDRADADEALLEVRGTGSFSAGRLVPDGGFIVGLEAEARLLVADGGLVESYGSLVAGDLAEVRGHVEVTGADSRLVVGLTDLPDLPVPLVVGRIGKGELLVNGGGAVEALRGIVIGREEEGDGIVRLDGAGTRLDVADGNATIGRSGRAAMTVGSGSTLAVDRLVGGSIIVAENADSEGALDVIGPDAVVDTPALVVAERGRASVALESRGAIRSGAGVVAAATGGFGIVEVSGTGSRWDLDESPVIGASGTGRLFVRDGGRVSAMFSDRPFEFGVGPDAVAEVEVTRGGATLDCGASALHAGVNGTADVLVADGASLFSSASRSADGAGAVIGLGPTSVAAVEVRDSATAWTIADGRLDDGREGAGTLRVLDGAAVFSSGGIAAEAVGSTAEIELAGLGAIWSSAGAPLELGRDGVVDVLVRNFATLAAGNATAGPGSTIRGDGALSVNRLVTSGRVQPGVDGPGVLLLNGDVELEDDAVLAVDLDGLSIGSGFDQISVTGSATVAGTVEVEFGPGFVPEIGDAFPVIAASGGLTGTMDAVVVGSACYEVAVETTATSLRIRVVGTLDLGRPLPGEAGLVNAIELCGATPNGPVILAGGFVEGSRRVPDCPVEVVLAIRNPRVLDVRTADGEGRATFLVDVPVQLAGRQVRLQAVDRLSCTVSDVETYRFPDE